MRARMLKTLTPLAALASLALSGAAHAQIYQSSFEGTDGGFVGTIEWQRGVPQAFIASTAPCDGTPVSPPTGAFDGSECWGTNLAACHANIAQTSVLSQNFNLSTSTNNRLLFNHWQDSGGNTFDMCIVRVNGTQVFLGTGTTGGSWQEADLDLSAFDGNSSVDISFEFVATAVVNRAGFYVDNVRIQGDVAAPGVNYRLQINASTTSTPTGAACGVTFTGTVNNIGLTDATAGADFSAPLPGNASFVSGSGASLSMGNIVASIPALASGAAFSFSFVLSPDAEGTMGVAGTVTAISDVDTDPSNNSATRNVEVSNSIPNNACCAATNLNMVSFPFNEVVDHSLASNGPDAGTCSASLVGRADAWYVYTAPGDGSLFMNESSGQDIVWGVYSDCTSAAVSCLATDTSQLVSMTTGQTVYIQIAAQTDTTLITTLRNITFDFLTPPLNADCSDAELVNSFPFAATVANISATDSGSLGGCERFGDVWYQLVAPDNGAFVLNETGTQTAAFGVYDADPCGGGAAFLLCNTTQTGLSVFPVFSGQSYWVRVGTAAAATSRATPLSLNFTFSSSPANDLCDDADVLDLNSGGSVTIDARAAQNDNDVDCNGVTAEAIAGVWYTFTTTDGGLLNINETSTATVATQLYTGTCNSLVTVVGSCSTTQNRNLTLAANTTYFMIMSMSAGTRPAVPYAFSFAFTPAMGACCNGSTCTIVTQSACVSGNGVYQGDAMACLTPPTGTPQYTSNVVIPITNNATNSGTIDVFDAGTIIDFAVQVTMNHTFLADLNLSISNGIATAFLTENSGSGNDVNGTYVFSDTGAIVLPAAGNLPPSGTYLASAALSTPVNLNAIFAGQPIAGTWTLSMFDDATGDTGQISEWGLFVNSGMPVCMGGAPCPGDYNDDGMVDLLDLLAFNGEGSGNLGTMVPMGTLGDYDGSGTVDLLDLLAFNGDWSSNLGTPCP